MNTTTANTKTLRNIRFTDGTVLQTTLTNDQLAYQHGWKQFNDGQETVFTGWRYELIEGSDGEYVHERYTTAIANAAGITVYAF